jgi:hypothetical protein
MDKQVQSLRAVLRTAEAATSAALADAASLREREEAGVGSTATLLAELTQLRDQLGAAIRLVACGIGGVPCTFAGEGAGFVLSINVSSLLTVAESCGRNLPNPILAS